MSGIPIEGNPANVMISFHSRLFIPLTAAQEMKNKNKRGKAISVTLTDILILEIMVPGGKTVKNRAGEEYSWQSLQCKYSVLPHQHAHSSPIKAVYGKSTLKFENFLKRVRRQHLEESLEIEKSYLT